MSETAYLDYWLRKQILSEVPHFGVRRWWRTGELCDIERVYFDEVRSAPFLLDVGAGDLRVRDKFLAAGFAGEYHTQDIGGEFAHTYRSLDEVKRRYAAILCLDVLEHLKLEDGLALIDRLIDLLDDDGVLIFQTPNARCIRSPFGWDLTHVHLYNVTDLWALARARNLNATGYRVWFALPRLSLGEWLVSAVGRYICTRLLGCDYADNIAIVAHKETAINLDNRHI